MFSNHYSHLCLSANMLFYASLFPSPQTDKVKESCLSTSNSIQLSCLSASFESLYQTLAFSCTQTFLAERLLFLFLFICIILVFVITVKASVLRVHWDFIALGIKCFFTFICCIRRQELHRCHQIITPPTHTILCFVFHDRTQLRCLTFNTQPRVSCSLHVTLPTPPTPPLACYSGLSVQSSGL